MERASENLPPLRGSTLDQEAAAEAPVQVLAVEHTAGELVCFAVGDYTHALIRDDAGEEKSYWIGEVAVLYFLATHRDQPLQLTYEVRDVFIPEAGERMVTETLTAGSAGEVTADDWWRRVLGEAEGSVEVAEARFEAVFVQAVCAP